MYDFLSITIFLIVLPVIMYVLSFHARRFCQDAFAFVVFLCVRCGAACDRVKYDFWVLCKMSRTLVTLSAIHLQSSLLYERPPILIWNEEWKRTKKTHLIYDNVGCLNLAMAYCIYQEPISTRVFLFLSVSVSFSLYVSSSTLSFCVSV